MPVGEQEYAEAIHAWLVVLQDFLTLALSGGALYVGVTQAETLAGALLRLSNPDSSPSEVSRDASIVLAAPPETRTGVFHGIRTYLGKLKPMFSRESRQVAEDSVQRLENRVHDAEKKAGKKAKAQQGVGTGFDEAVDLEDGRGLRQRAPAVGSAYSQFDNGGEGSSKDRRYQTSSSQRLPIHVRPSTSGSATGSITSTKSAPASNIPRVPPEYVYYGFINNSHYAIKGRKFLRWSQSSGAWRSADDPGR